MKNPWNRPDGGVTRRWLVTLTILCAATVTAGVALNHRPSHAGATSRALTSAAPAFVGTPTAALSDPSVPDPYEAFRQGVSELSEPIATF